MRSFSSRDIFELVRAKKINKVIEVHRRKRQGKSPRWRKLWERDD